jgi:hypothetical protein
VVADPPAPDPASRRWLRGVVGASLAGFVVAVVAAPGSGESPARGLTWLLFVGSAVHVAGTGVLFCFGEVRAHACQHRHRYLVLPLALVAVAAALAGLLPQRALTTALLGYFGWQFFHYQKQNLGLAALAARSQQVQSLSAAERRALLASGWCGIAALLAHPSLLQLTGVAAWPVVDSAVRAGAAVGFVVATGYGVAALRRRPATQRPAEVTAVYLVGLGFPLPVFVCGSPYAAVGGMTIAHGLQYLLLVATVAAGPAGRRASRDRLMALATATVAAGALLSAASHLHTGGALARAGYGAYLGVVMTHFVVDAGLWRLRDPFPRSFVASRAPMLLGEPLSQASDASHDGVLWRDGATDTATARA